MGIDVSFVICRDAGVDPAAVVDAAGALGIALVHESSKGDEPLTFDASGAKLLVMPVSAVHPDAAQMTTGPLSPSVEDVASHSAHLIVTAMELTGDAKTRDRSMALMTAAVVAGASAVAAMLGHGVLFVRSEVFTGMAEAAAETGEVPVELCVDVTAARESETHMSLLTHGLTRYDREEFYVTCPIEGQGAFGFVLAMARWMVHDPDKQLPTGDTIGRNENERIAVQRVPHPAGDGPEVIYLQM